MRTPPARCPREHKAPSLAHTGSEHTRQSADALARLTYSRGLGSCFRCPLDGPAARCWQPSQQVPERAKKISCPKRARHVPKHSKLDAHGAHSPVEPRRGGHGGVLRSGVETAARAHARRRSGRREALRASASKFTDFSFFGR